MRERVLWVLVPGILLFAGVGEAMGALAPDGLGIGSFQEAARPGEPAVPGSPSQEDPPRTLAEFLTLARQENPALTASRLETEAAFARIDEAGLLPDPNLSLGVTNLALPEFSADMPASMAPMIQASQRFPLAGKRGIRSDVARLGASIQEARSDEVWWRLRTAVATAYYDLFRIDREREILTRTMGLVRDLETVALSSYATGGGPQADVLRAGVARTRLVADEATLVARRAGANARLNRLLNRPAETPVPKVEGDPSPLDLPASDSLMTWAAAYHPGIQALRASVQRAEATATLAGKAMWPDLTVGFQYGLGRMDGDRRSMGGATVGFSLPIYAGKRQGRLQDEAQALEAAARERLQDAMNTVGADVTTILAELERHRLLLTLYQDDILPQARASVESSLAGYRVGEVRFSDLIDAQLLVNQFEAEYFGALASFGSAVARLEHAVGRTLSPDHELIKEIP